MEDWQKTMKKTVEPLAIRYFGGSKTAEFRDKVRSEVERYFPMAASDDDFRVYKQGAAKVLGQSVSDWVYSVYMDETDRQLKRFTYAGKHISFTKYLLQQFRYKLKTSAIDMVAIEYVACSRRNYTWKMLLWEMTYNLFENIQYFDGLARYHSYKIQGYEDAVGWMRDVYSDTILYCMERYDPFKKKSFANYTVDYFKFKMKDAMKEVIRKQQIEQTTDGIEKYGERNDDLSEKPIRHYHDKEEQAISCDVLNGHLVHIITLIIQLYQKQSEGRKSKTYVEFMNGSCAKKLTKAEYFRLIYTENVIHVVKLNVKYGYKPGDLRYEREVFITVKKDMLDYLMRDICRSYAELSLSPIKRYDDILHDGDEKSIKLPLHEAIYAQYFVEILQINRNRKSVAASISRYRGEFKEQIKLLQEGTGRT